MDRRISRTGLVLALVLTLSLVALPVGAFCGYCGDSSQLTACYFSVTSRSGCRTYRCRVGGNIIGDIEVIQWAYCCEDTFECI